MLSWRPMNTGSGNCRNKTAQRVTVWPATTSASVHTATKGEHHEVLSGVRRPTHRKADKGRAQRPKPSSGLVVCQHRILPQRRRNRIRSNLLTAERQEDKMKCKSCGEEIIRIDTMGGKIVCNAEPVTYYRSNHPDSEILTPNGETVYCKLSGPLSRAIGIGYTLHTCAD